MEAGISNYLLTQGVLGIAVLVLGIVVVYQQKKLDRQDVEIRQGYKDRLDDNKLHAADYKEMAKDNQEVLQGNSQSNLILAEKIEVVKGRR